MKCFISMSFKLKIFVFFLFSSTFSLNAQNKYNILFQKGLSWSQIKYKAKQENKYIFVDGYTTWCAPCRLMAADIFTQKEVADFFNKNFINVSVQFNVTKKDSNAVKSWYKDADELLKQYKIDSYPTYLFFNPDGIMIHSIIGATKDAAEFISKSKLSLSPQTQFITLKQEYESGKRDSDFLISLINVTQLANSRKFLPIVVNTYLATQKDLLTLANLRLIIKSTTKTTDPGFAVLLNNPSTVDEVGGKGTASDIITNILFDEIVLSMIRIGGKKTDYGGGMVVYSGEIEKNVNWYNIKDTLDKKYPKYSVQTIQAAKPIYYQWQTDWLNYTQAVTSYISNFRSEISYDKINSYAWTILANCDDKKSIASAIEWSTITISDKLLLKPYFLYTYSDLLYKAGRKDEAIAFLEDTTKGPEATNKNLTDLLDKIKQNEKTW